MKKIAIYSGLFVLLGCQAGPYPVSSPYYTIPAGSKLTLHQALVIPPNTARVYLQYGNVVTEKLVDRYYAHCWLRSWKLLETEQVIKPDTFVILKVKEDEELATSNTPIQLASVGGGSDGSSDLEYTTTLTIQSETQPDIRQFACSRWLDPTDPEYLTVAQIRQALGKIANLILAE